MPNENEIFPDECTACGNIMGLCTCEPVLLQVTNALVDKGYSVSYEYPGYASVFMPNGRSADFGNANTNYTANWSDCKPDEYIDFGMPATATVEELVAAIEGWIASQGLSARAAEILKHVIEAMQAAEEMDGPEDYVPLMEVIAFEANQRITTYRQINGGTK